MTASKTAGGRPPLDQAGLLGGGLNFPFARVPVRIFGSFRSRRSHIAAASRQHTAEHCLNATLVSSDIFSITSWDFSFLTMLSHRRASREIQLAVTHVEFYSALIIMPVTNAIHWRPDKNVITSSESISGRRMDERSETDLGPSARMPVRIFASFNSRLSCGKSLQVSPIFQRRVRDTTYHVSLRVFLSKTEKFYVNPKGEDCSLNSWQMTAAAPGVSGVRRSFA
jgi:hypothetical protein